MAERLPSTDNRLAGLQIPDPTQQSNKNKIVFDDSDSEDEEKEVATKIPVEVPRGKSRRPEKTDFLRPLLEGPSPDSTMLIRQEVEFSAV